MDVQSEIPADANELNALAMRIARSRADIVLCFCITINANSILTAVRRYLEANMLNRTHIVWIASDSWATSLTAIEGVEEFADGVFGVAPFAREYVNFTNYFTNINPTTSHTISGFVVSSVSFRTVNTILQTQALSVLVP